jgi:hypothetical protein
MIGVLYQYINYYNRKYFVSRRGEVLHMETLKAYVVTKGSSDGTLKAGDKIRLSENGDLNIPSCAGWLTKDEWDSPRTNDFDVELCNDYYVDVTQYSEALRKVDD